MAATRPGRHRGLVVHRRGRASSDLHLERGRRPATAAADAASTASPASTAFWSGWSNGRRRCLGRFDGVILARGRGDRGRALRGGALTRNRHGAGGGALGDGAFVTVGLGQGGGGLDARGAALRNRLGHRGSGRR